MHCVAQESMGLGRPQTLSRNSPTAALVAFTHHGKPYLETDLDAVEYVDSELDSKLQVDNIDSQRVQQPETSEEIHSQNFEASQISLDSHAHTQIILKPKPKQDVKVYRGPDSLKSVSFSSASTAASSNDSSVAHRNVGLNERFYDNSIKLTGDGHNGTLIKSTSEDTNNNKSSVRNTTTTTSAKVSFRECDIQGANPDSTELSTDSTVDDVLPSRHRPLKRIIARNLKDCKRSRSQDVLGGGRSKNGSLGIKRFRVHPARVSGLFGKKSQSEQHINWQCDEETVKHQYRSQSKDCVVNNNPDIRQRLMITEHSVKVGQVPITVKHEVTEVKQADISMREKGGDAVDMDVFVINPALEGNVDNSVTLQGADEEIQRKDHVSSSEINTDQVQVKDNNCENVLAKTNVLENKHLVFDENSYDPVEENVSMKAAPPNHIERSINYEENKASNDKIALDTVVTEVTQTSFDHSTSPVHLSSSHEHTSSNLIISDSVNPKSTGHSETMSQIIRRTVPLKSAEINEHIYEDTLELLEEVDISDSFGSVEYAPPSSGSEDDSTYPDSTSEGSFTLDDITPEPTFFPQPKGLPPLAEDINESEEEHEAPKTKILQLESNHTSANAKTVLGVQKSPKAPVKTSPWDHNGSSRYLQQHKHHHQVPTHKLVSAATVSTVTMMPKQSMSRYEEQQILQKIHEQVEEKIRQTEYQMMDENQTEKVCQTDHQISEDSQMENIPQMEHQVTGRNTREKPLSLENQKGDEILQKSSKPTEHFFEGEIKSQNVGVDVTSTEEPLNNIVSRGEHSGKLKEVFLDNHHLLVEVSEDSAFDETMISPVSSEKSPTDKRVTVDKISQSSSTAQSVNSSANVALFQTTGEESASNLNHRESNSLNTPPIKPSLLELKIHQIKQKYSNPTSQSQKLPGDHSIAMDDPSLIKTEVKSETVVQNSSKESEIELQYSELLREMSIEGDYQQVNTTTTNYASPKSSSNASKAQEISAIVTTSTQAKSELDSTIPSTQEPSQPFKSSFLASHQTSVYENRNKSFTSSRLSDSADSNTLQQQDIDLDLDKLLSEFPSAETKPKILGDFNLEDEVFGELSTEKKQLQQKPASHSEVVQHDFLSLLASCNTPLASKSCSQIPSTKVPSSISKENRNSNQLRVSLGNLAAPGNDVLELTMELEEPTLSYSQLTIGRRRSRKSSSDSLPRGDSTYKTLQRMRSELGKPVQNKEVIFTRKRGG